MEDLIKDFTVVVGSRKLRTNRGCLEKHSDYFKAMFSSGMRESRTSSVKLQNVDEELMCQIIEFCERGVRIRVSENNALRLLAAGMMLQMEALKDSAEQYLAHSLTLASVTETFKAADFYGSSFLRENCGKFTCWSLEELVDRLTPENFELVHYILRREYSHWNENLIFRAVMAVIRGRSVEDAQKLFECLYVHNISHNTDAFNLYRNAEFGLKGHRKDSSTLAIVLGGRDTLFLDRRSLSFVQRTRLPIECVGYGLVAHRQHWYLIGGEDRIGFGKWNKTVYRYDFLRNTWEHFVDMPDCRRSFSIFATNTKIYVIGGYGKFRKSLEGEIAVLDLETRTWDHGELRNSRLPGADGWFSLLYSDENFYLLDSIPIRKVREENLGRSVGDFLDIANFPREPIKYSLPFGHDMIVITVQDTVYFCNMTTNSANKLEQEDAKTFEPDFVSCNIIDRTLFNAKKSMVIEYLIDIETLTLRRMKTYSMPSGSCRVISTSCKIPYF